MLYVISENGGNLLRSPRRMLMPLREEKILVYLRNRKSGATVAEIRDNVKSIPFGKRLPESAIRDGISELRRRGYIKIAR